MEVRGVERTIGIAVKIGSVLQSVEPVFHPAGCTRPPSVSYICSLLRGCIMIQIAGNNPILLQDLFDRFYRPRKLLGRSKSTAYQYGIQIRHFGRFLGRAPTTADLDDDVLAAFLQWFLDGVDRGGRSRSPDTANKARSHLLALWRFANATGRVATGPTIEELPTPEKAPVAWTEDELATLLAGCAAQRGWIAGIRACDYWLSMHYWWLCGGERTSATLAVLWSWVDLRNAVITVPGNVRKASKTITYAISPQCVDALRKIKDPEREKVWPWPWCRDTFYNRYEKLVASCGLPTKGAGPQKMRRSFASHLTANGGDATQALHHSNRSVTLKSYIDPRIARPVEHWRSMPTLPST